MLGTLSGDPQGLIMIGRWRMINMFYRIIELKDRDDLIQLLLGNMDFSLYVPQLGAAHCSNAAQG